jgi:hypothetical protein
MPGKLGNHRAAQARHQEKSIFIYYMQHNNESKSQMIPDIPNNGDIGFGARAGVI